MQDVYDDHPRIPRGSYRQNPWQQNDSYWDQGQLFFTPDTVWGMPPFYAQQMIARHYQPLGVRAVVEGAATALDVSATRSADGRTCVFKVFNLEASVLLVAIVWGIEWGAGSGCLTITTLSGPLEGVNTREGPHRISPVACEQAWDGGAIEHLLPGHSFTVLRSEWNQGSKPYR